MEALWIILLCAPPVCLLCILGSKKGQNDREGVHAAGLGLAAWFGASVFCIGFPMLACVGGGCSDYSYLNAIFILYGLISASIIYFVYRRAYLKVQALTLKVLLWLIVIFTFLPTILLGLLALNAGDQWLNFHRKELQGKVVEADTNMPVEGALITAEWWGLDLMQSSTGLPPYFIIKASPFYLIGECLIHKYGRARESILAITDKNGFFKIHERHSFKPWAYIERGWVNPFIQINKPGYATLKKTTGDWYYSTLLKGGNEDHWYWYMQGHGIAASLSNLPLVKLRTDVEIIEDYNQNYEMCSSCSREDARKEIEYFEKALENVSFESRNKIKERLTKSGTYEGIAKQYYENGNLQSEKTYKDGKLDGTTRWYDKNGKLQNEETYKDGKRIGTAKMVR